MYANGGRRLRPRPEDRGPRRRLSNMEEMTVSSLSVLDQWLNRSLATMPVDYQWLLLQTVATAASRRNWIESWPDVPGGLIIDMGCGPGVVAQEIALLKSCQVLGCDRDTAVLELAQNINRLFNQDDRVKFRMLDILQETGNHTADGLVSRFVAQYIADLPQFFQKLQTHVKPGGYIAIEDVDDGYLVEYPAPPTAWLRVIGAFQEHQKNPGGDRFVGRRLAEFGGQSGLNMLNITVVPSVYAGWMESQNISVQWDIDRIDRAMPQIIRQGLLREEDWLQAKALYRASFPHFTYMTSATVRILFQVPRTDGL